MKEGDVYETLRRLAARLKEEGLAYAVAGGMALVAHGSRRFTEAVDILLTPEALRLPLEMETRLDSSVRGEYRRLRKAAQAALSR